MKNAIEWIADYIDRDDVVKEENAITCYNNFIYIKAWEDYVFITSDFDWIKAVSINYSDPQFTENVVISVQNIIDRYRHVMQSMAVSIARNGRNSTLFMGIVEETFHFDETLSLDILYDVLYDLASMRKFNCINDMLFNIDVDKVNMDILLGLLTCLRVYRKQCVYQWFSKRLVTG